MKQIVVFEKVSAKIDKKGYVRGEVLGSYEFEQLPDAVKVMILTSIANSFLMQVESILADDYADM